MTGVRLDKYLFAIRLFKSRSLAAEECRKGKISVNNIEAKASRELNIGDSIGIKQLGYKKTIQVNQLIDKRVGAPIAVTMYTDITNEEELLKKAMLKEIKPEYRPRGLGRPTKKDRRLIDSVKNQN